MTHYLKSWLKTTCKTCQSNYQSMSLITTALTTQQQQSRSFHTDSDSFLIAVHNCTSLCMTPSLQDFVKPPRPTPTTITSMGGTATASHIGTVRWSVEDDQGVTHDLTIPDTRYCPEAPFRLLCPQHLAQQSNEPSSVLCLTTHQQVILSWQGFTKTIPLLDGSNVALFRSSAGYSTAMALMEDYPQPVCFESHVIPNDEPDDTRENPDNITRDVDRTSEGTRKTDENIAPSTEIPRKTHLIDDDIYI